MMLTLRSIAQFFFFFSRRGVFEPRLRGNTGHVLAMILVGLTLAVILVIAMMLALVILLMMLTAMIMLIVGARS